jgi:hypothetical protein
MNHLIAQTKGKNSGLYKVISNKSIFDLPDDLDNPKAYNSDYNLEEDEWFHIPSFSTTDYCIEFLKKTFIATEYDQIKTSEFDKIQFLCAYQSGVYYFQKLSSTQLIQKKWFTLSTAPVLEENKAIIVINDFPDAVYVKSEDILYFKRLPAIFGIFKGITELYKEATQQETETFLKNSFIKLEDDYNADKVKTANRKRIALAMETFKKFTPKEKKSVSAYIKDYCQNLSYDEKKSNFTIKSEDDLKHLLWGIEQRYYTTPISNEKRVANSVSPI